MWLTHSLTQMYTDGYFLHCSFSVKSLGVCVCMYVCMRLQMRKKENTQQRTPLTQYGKACFAVCYTSSCLASIHTNCVDDFIRMRFRFACISMCLCASTSYVSERNAYTNTFIRFMFFNFWRARLCMCV